MNNNSAIFMIFKLLFLAIFLLSLPGCSSYKIDTRSYVDNYPLPLSSEDCHRIRNQIRSLEHPLYRYIPRHRDQIQWYDLGHWLAWMLAGNDDDGLFGEGAHAHYKLDQPPSAAKAFTWGCRNPLHNFCFYVIGSAQRENSEFALAKFSHVKGCSFLSYCPSTTSVFADKGTSFFLGFHGWKPFISARVIYSAKYEGIFYFGWRERGNFGMKLQPYTKRKWAKKQEQSGGGKK